GGIHADEHLDRPVVRALERLELRRPEREPEQLGLPAALWGCAEGLEVRRVTFLRREPGGFRKQALELRAQLAILDRLALHGRRSDETTHDGEQSESHGGASSSFAPIIASPSSN